jgi:hypothetical protein
METYEEPSVVGGVRAEVKTVSWRAISLHTEMTVWVKCSRGAAAWTLPIRVLPTLEVEPCLPRPEGAPTSDVKLAAQLAASSYVAKNRTGLKEIFKRTY